MRRLRAAYPDAGCTLDFSSPLELLIATVLSAQCTDERVNRVTPALFKRFPSAGVYAAAPLDEIEGLIRPTGFFRSKARSLQGIGKALDERFGGRVPETLEDLVTLPGVGRKTANCILVSAFGKPGITVDTHCGRVARRLGFARDSDPVKVEFALQRLFPEKDWATWSHVSIFHGRRCCRARKPDCSGCPVGDRCPSAGWQATAGAGGKGR